MARDKLNGITLVVDLDGVVANFAEAVCQWYGREYQPELMTHWHNPLIEGYEQVLFRPEFHAILRPYAQAWQAIGGRWDSGFRIKIATSRPPGTEHLVVNWLKSWDIPFDDLLLGENKNLAGKHILLDDKPENVRDYADRVGPAILVRQPWNWSVRRLPGTLYPVEYGLSWPDIVEKTRIWCYKEGLAGKR